MAFIGTALSVAENLETALGLLEVKDKLSTIFDYESELEDLRRTVGFISAVLRDAEAKQELSHELQYRIEELKDALFEADDLLDEFVTLAHHQRVVDADGSLLEKIKHFFSGSNPIYVSYWMSGGIKDIKKKLDAIAYNDQFSLRLNHEPIRNRRPETCSYVNKVEIIGRQHDLDHIVDKYLTSDDQSELSFLTIVGLGGFGKTALAQLVYNNPRVASAFPLRLWTCVADQDREQFNVKDILGKILGHNQQGSTMDQVQSQLRERLAGKRFLLVLDDVWTENRNQWQELIRYLKNGERGSWIMVTTRSQNTATITGGSMYELKGLSEEYSWRLFKSTAFTSDQLSNQPHDLVEIGRKIVDGCVGVPLSIRVAGSLLFGQDKSEWQSVQMLGLANIRHDKDDIMPILKLSYNHLETPSLKSCFRYCALFPKDFVMEKEMLISLWMAQGYIVPFHVGQSLEEAAEDYFSILLRRCFFQDIQKDEFGEIVSCKMHDLMHDVAQSVSGKEIISTNTITSDETGNLIKRARHLLIAVWRYDKYYLGQTYIRSLLLLSRFGNGNISRSGMESLVGNCRGLRALDLSGLKLKSLPDSIGELLHLRYLDLSWNHEIEVLPKSITKLYNLQTLKLSWCERLKELPDSIGELLHLRYLDLSYNKELEVLPKSITKLYNLQTLKLSWCERLKELPDSIGELLHLRYLILHDCNFIEVLPESITKLYNLQTLKLSKCGRLKELPDSIGELLHLRYLDLSYNKELEVLPKSITKLYNLQTLKLSWCERLKELPDSISELLHLRYLILHDCNFIEVLPESITKLYNLQTLKLSKCGRLKELPDSIGELLHLRYLDLSFCIVIEVCPESITKLYNLQTLNLSCCFGLKELPKDLSKLVKLRVLDIQGCDKLRYMPRGIGKLSGLERLSHFIVGGDEWSSRSSYLKQVADGLEDLKALNNLKGELRIMIRWCRDGENVVNEEDSRVMQALHREGLYLMNKEYLSAIHISFIGYIYGVPGAITSLMEDLQPHSNLKEFHVFEYGGVRIPWINHLPNLVSLHLTCCKNLEYTGSSSEAPLQLPYLSELSIMACRKLACTMMCPSLEKLELRGFNEGMRIIMTSSSSSSCSDILVPKLKSMKIDNVAWIESLPMKSLRCLETLEILHDSYGEPSGNRLFDWWDDRQHLRYWIHNLPALQTLIISRAGKLKAIPKWMSELTTLTNLNIWGCSESLKRRCQQDPPGEDWPHIKHIPYIDISRN